MRFVLPLLHLRSIDGLSACERAAAEHGCNDRRRTAGATPLRELHGPRMRARGRVAGGAEPASALAQSERWRAIRPVAVCSPHRAAS